jgi:acetate kinase
MKVLTFNCGSSSLKFDLMVATAAATSRIAQGAVERIGPHAEAWLEVDGRRRERPISATDQRSSVKAAIGLLSDITPQHQIEAIAHRDVHGGPHFHDAALLDSDVIRAIENASELAPLHNAPALEAIQAARDHFGPEMPMVADFDTAFYSGLPDVAREYALPRDLRERMQIRRYGFHGLAHRYMIQRYRALRPAVGAPRLITLQLGSGCSATATRDGRPLDTSMGFTPLEGLIMGTRSGDIDPMLPLLLVERAGMTVDRVEALLNRESGLLGLSCRSNDMREVLEAARSGDKDSDLAVRAFSYRVQKYIGAYLAVLGGADAIVFGGGVGERSAEIRQAVCAGLDFCGVKIDSAANHETMHSDTFITTPTAATEVLVVMVDEAQVMAEDAFKCLTRAGSVVA